MNKKIASEIAIGILLLLVIVVGGIFWMQNKKVQTFDSQENSKQSVAQAPQPAENFDKVDEVQNSQPASETTPGTYTNAAHNFTLQIPDDWQGYTTRISKGSIYFSLPSYGDVFMITVYSNYVWNKKQNSGEVVSGEVIGKSDKYTYVFEQDASLTETNTPDDPKLAAQLKEVDGIKKSFALTAQK